MKLEGLAFLKPFKSHPSSKQILRKIYISDWEGNSGLELISDDLLSLLSAWLIYGFPYQLETLKALDLRMFPREHTGPCLATSSKMWLKPACWGLRPPAFPTTEAWGLHSSCLLDVVDPGGRVAGILLRNRPENIFYDSSIISFVPFSLPRTSKYYSF